MARIKTIKPEFWAKENDGWGQARRHIYLIQEGADGPIKVGVAGHPTRRLTTLQAGNSRRLYLCAVYSGTPEDCCEVERQTLKHFGRLSGEWLRDNNLDDVVGFLNTFDDGEQA
jgi:hypothetical protein